MPTIPMYEQRTSPQGLVNVQPSGAGQAMGREVSQFGQGLGQAAQVIAGAIGQQNAAEEASRAQIEAERRQREMEEGRLLAMAVSAQAEGAARDMRKNWEAERVQDNGTISMVESAPYKSFQEEAEAAFKPMIERAAAANPYAEKFLAPTLQQISYSENERLNDFSRNRRDAWIQSQVENGIESDAKTIFESDDPQREFSRLSSGWDAQLSSREIGSDRIPLEVRDRILEGKRKLLTTTAEQRELDLKGADEYLRSRGLSSEGKALGMERRARPGAEMPASVSRWQSQINAAAEEAGIDPMLLAALIEQESRGNPNAKSPVGAIGLAQLMPATARELGVDPNDPVQNLRGGAMYLAQQLAQFDGDPEKALAAYNAGPHTVKRAVSAAGDGGDWKASMRKFQSADNFKQTQDYVPRIMSRYDGATEMVNAAPDPSTLPASWKALTPEEQVRWREQAVRAASQKRSETAESLRTWFTNADALAKAGQVPQGAPTLAETVRAYGPERGVQMWTQAKSLVRLGQNMAGLADVSDQEILLRGKDLAPDPNDQQSFAINQGIHQDYMNAADQVIRERRRAPLEWAMRNNPSVSRAAQAFAATPDNPAARESYVNAATAAQRRYGVEQPLLLTDGQAAQTVKALSDPQRYEFVAAEVEGLQRKWGPHWPMVYRQLSKDLPPAVDVIASGIPPQTAATLARMMPMKTDDLRNAVSPDDKRHIKSELPSVLDPFVRSMASTNPVDGLEKSARFAGEVERLALHYTGQGMGAEEALQKAAGDVVLTRYSFVPQEGTMRDPSGGRVSIAPVYRVPKENDPGVIRKGAERFRETIAPDLLLPPVGMGASEWSSEVMDSGYWVTNGDETGLELHVAGDPVVDTSGARVVASWADLTARANDPTFWSRTRDALMGRGGATEQPARNPRTGVPLTQP